MYGTMNAVEHKKKIKKRVVSSEITLKKKYRVTLINVLINTAAGDK